MSEATEKKRFKVPHTYVIIFTVIIVCAILSYIVPAGVYDRVEVNGRNLVDPQSFHYVDQTPVGPLDLFLSVPLGMIQAASIAFCIFIVGGSFYILNQTGAIEAAIGRVALKLRNMDIIMIGIVMLIFMIFGTTFGMAEECIVFVPIGIALCRALGYDAITGTAMITLAATCGFTCGAMNPFTVGVAQTIAELPMFSGAPERLGFGIVMLIVTAVYIVRYAKRVKADPSKSKVRELEIEEKDKVIDLNNLPQITTRHILVLLTMGIGIGLIIFGVFKLGWYIDEISAIFLAMGIIGGLLGGMVPDQVAKEFVAGAKDIAFGALICGVARGILVILTDGQIIDTLIHGMALAISNLPKEVSVLGMYVVQNIISVFIPSGSGMAAATMPIMVPLSDVLGINRQIAVTVFHLADGFSNNIIPTSGGLMGVLSIAKIPYEKWVSFLWPLMCIWLVLGIGFIMMMYFMNFGPF